MTDLIKELEAVVGKKCDFEGMTGTAKQMDRAIGDASHAAYMFVYHHHAEIAEAVKDARRYRLVRGSTNNEGFWIAHGPVGFLSRWTGDNADIQIDAAIDAMHNSAREVGE
jgi:hypothetical protein